MTEGPGSQLKSAREAMDVSVREVADALNLSMQVVEAMEADDFANLPPVVFARGYLRSYARLLELDPESIIALFPETLAEPAFAETTELFDADGAPDKPIRGIALPRRTAIWLAVAAVVAALVIIGLVVMISGDEEASRQAQGKVTEQPAEPGEASTPADSEQTSADPPRDTSPDVPIAIPDRTDADVSSDEPVETTRKEPAELTSRLPSAAENPSGPATGIQAVDTTVPAQTTPAGRREFPPSSEPGVRRITEFGDDELTFYFIDECWVEVKSRDGENLYSDLNRAGQTLRLEGRGPFRILLGYAPGVELSFNGEPVALAAHTRNNVASLVLGQ